MFIIAEADAAAIRAVFDQEGELSAAIELRRLFPGQREGAGVRPDHRRMDAAASPVARVTRLRPPQEQLSPASFRRRREPSSRPAGAA
jgi:hypothetical protein